MGIVNYFEKHLRQLVQWGCIFLGVLVFCLCYLTIDSLLIRSIVVLALIIQSLMVSLGVIRMEKTTMNQLEKLSEMIQRLGSSETVAIVENCQDTLISKIQHQLTELHLFLELRKEGAQREKDRLHQLISDIAHQLKTPMANLQLYQSFLEDPAVDESVGQSFRKRMGEQLDKLSWLMDGLMKMSKIESGLLTLRPELASVLATVIRAIDMSRLQAEAKGIDIQLTYEGDIEVLHDVKWTAEALFNLLDNAVKYSDSYSSIEVSIKVSEVFVTIDVTDSGLGVSKEEITKIFARFYRGAVVQKSEGVGIGLYLARKIMTEHQGYVLYRHNHPKGSIFSMGLPVNITE